MTVPSPAYSPIRRAGDLLFVSGQLGTTPDSPAGDVSSQTRQALEKLEAHLISEGANRSDIVKCTVFLTSMGDWSAMNEVFASFFSHPYPARSAVAVELIGSAVVEIEAVAYLPVQR